ncbi:DUF2953 domain-containing protein [Peptoclostridium litorale]|uniref:DUF2953 domain-containing protein n=1 Tax=Peptoclostridium litorale TaxID=1557 RepID=UPI001A9A5C39|nr:DUF2953 domain-containing protein [Peptoclostridium litorale]
MYIEISWFFKLIKTTAFFQSGLKPKTDFIFAGHGIDVSGNGKKEKKPPGEKEKKTDKNKKKMHPKHVLSKSMLKSISDLLSDFLRWLKPKKFRLRGMVGFEDPHHTGMLCGLLYIFEEPLRNSGINIISIFDREVFEGSFEIEGKLTIAVLLLICMKFVLSKPVRRIISYQIRR